MSTISNGQQSVTGASSAADEAKRLRNLKLMQRLEKKYTESEIETPKQDYDHLTPDSKVSEEPAELQKSRVTSSEFKSQTPQDGNKNEESKSNVSTSEKIEMLKKKERINNVMGKISNIICAILGVLAPLSQRMKCLEGLSSVVDVFVIGSTSEDSDDLASVLGMKQNRLLNLSSLALRGYSQLMLVLDDLTVFFFSMVLCGTICGE